MALADLLNHIDQMKAEANALRPIDPIRLSALNQKLRLEWNYHSNAIEGNTLTLSETRMLLLHGYHTGNKLGRHYDEISYHNDVLISLEEIVRRKDPLTETLIRSLHQRMMGDDYTVKAHDSMGNLVNVKGQPGSYKTKQNGVRRIVNGEEVFVPFKTPDEVRAEMPELIEWYREEEKKQELHPVLIAATFHYRFVTLHPFDDGNGRMGRILMNLILMRAGYVPAIIKLEERDQYIKALASAQDGESLDAFINILAKEAERSMGLLVKAAKGESVDEPGDLDKRVSMLERMLDGLSDEIKLLKSDEVMQTMPEMLIEPLFRATYKKLLKVSQLFSYGEFGFSINSIGYTMPNIDKLMEIFHSTWDNNKGRVDDVKFNIRFAKLKKLGHDAFDITDHIKLTFEDHRYQVEIRPKQIQSRLYHQLPTESEINEWAEKFAKDVVTGIEARVKAINDQKLR